MKLPRTTVRRLLAAVAIAGLGLGSWSWMARRSTAFLAESLAHRERAYHVSLACRIDHVLLEHHEALARKYERAARYPWLPVALDPPEPE